MLNARQYVLLSGTVFTVVGVLHLLRIVNSWPLIIGDFEAPMSLSMLAVILAAFLAFSAWKLKD